MNDVPIDAISRLNAHARAFGQGYRAIYAYKTLAAVTLAMDGAATIRFVRWIGTCNRCTNGRYSHWEWEDGYTVRCRDCGGTGERALRFTATTLPNGDVWHHPWEGPNSSGRDIATEVLGLAFVDDGRGNYHHETAIGQRIEWRDPGEWRPNLPPARLETAELVPLLNQVEDWVDASTAPAGCHWMWEKARRYLRKCSTRSYAEFPDSYQLDIGRAPGGCFVCGDEGDLSGCYGRMTPLLHWSLPVCKRHGQGPDKVPFPKDPPPDALITPDIRRWLERHESVERLR